MRIYTRTGDDGTTSLFGGQRLSKDDLRIEAYGTLDELNVCIGAMSTRCVAESEDAAFLRAIQSDVFSWGSHGHRRSRNGQAPAAGSGYPRGRNGGWMDAKNEALPR